MTESFAADGLRIICAALDRIIYAVLIPAFYNLIETMADLQVFSDNSIQTFAERVYSLLALFMLFKISFSFITYIVNPDQMTDKQNGASNIIKNVIIVLVLIIITPRAFSLIREAQSAILNDNILPKFILGGDNTNQSLNKSIKYYDNSDGVYCVGYDTTVNAKTAGDYISIMIFKGFFTPEGKDPSDLENTNYCEIKSENTTVADFLDVKYNNAKGGTKEKYEINYWVIISTIVGVVVALMLLNMCFDVTVRAIKLGFLEIISPIPIISYLDPKSGKNGMFKNWLKEVGKTWASLFIRLASIFFAVYVIQQFTGANFAHAFAENGFIVEIFVVIGALMFAKQLPGLLESLIPGLKMGGGFQLNPFKKIENEALGGKQLLNIPRKAISTTVGAGAAVGGLLYANNQRKKQLNKQQSESDAAQYRLNLEKSKRDLAANNYNVAKERRERLDELLNNKLSKGMELNEQDYKTRARLLQKEAKAEGNLNQANLAVDNAEIIANNKQSELEKTQKANDVFSYNHPLATGLLQAFRGAKIAIDDKDAANVIKAVISGVESAKKATKLRNDSDKFRLKDRLKDLGTDITGIKNESGTTSALKAAIKEQSEILNNIKNGIIALDHSFGNLSPGAVVYDSNGNRSIDISGTYSYSTGEKESIQFMIDQYNDLRKSEKETTKQIKEYEEILKINKKH